MNQEMGNEYLMDRTALGTLYELLSSTYVYYILLQNEGCSGETQLEVNRSVIGSPTLRQLHGNENPSRCTLFLREHTGIVIFLSLIMRSRTFAARDDGKLQLT